MINVVVRLFHHRFLPLVLCRLSRAAFLRRVPGVPQLCTYANLVLFGLEISPRCDIGPGLFLPHTNGTVIGAAFLGSNVTVFQGVTLGAKQVDMGFDAGQRPKVGNGVTLGSGAKILGGVLIGDGAVVGANSVVVSDVAPGVTVIGIPAKPTGNSTPNIHKEKEWNQLSI
jgi:serine O-acetyltransferase